MSDEHDETEDQMEETPEPSEEAAPEPPTRFVLSFLPQTGLLPDADALKQFARDHAHFESRHVDKDRELAYRNPDTAVTFQIRLMEQTDEDDEPVKVLQLHLDYCRPTYFAMECFATLQDFAETFKLDVLPPDEEGERASFSPQALLESWQRGNRSAVARRQEGEAALPLMPEAKSLEMWRYLWTRAQIQAMEEDFTVPLVVPVRVKGENIVWRGASLPAPCYLVVPPVDLFFFGDRGAVRAERVWEKLAPHLAEHDVWKWLRILDEQTLDETDVAAQWASLMETLPVDYTPDQYEEISLDAFVDE